MTIGMNIQTTCDAIVKGPLVGFVHGSTVIGIGDNTRLSTVNYLKNLQLVIDAMEVGQGNQETYKEYKERLMDLATGVYT